VSVAAPMSVVVAPIAGRRDCLENCLRSLVAQDGAPELDIVVPYDETIRHVTELAAAFPRVRFIPAPGLDTAAARRGASREHHDTLRAIGIGQATGAIVVLTEDHARVAPDWCRELAAALERHPTAAAVGGAVECGSAVPLNRAVWCCDFGRYGNPLPEGPAPYVSDSNVAYRRQALERVRTAWERDYRETVVHWALRQAGYAVCLTPRAVAWQERRDLTLWAALRERYVWGRSFAFARVQTVGPLRRAVYAAAAPALPVLLTFRLARTLQQRGRLRGFLSVFPLVLLLHAAWALGEFTGYATGKA